ncbi:MAG: hypothetical protein PHU25_21275, partial [Deltaproteobacteria bacterium]|nr:hypothetical protein [Deltaproteobacteria bacterium]
LDPELQTKATSMGQRVRIILGIAAVLIAVGVGGYFWMGSQKDLEANKDVRAAFEKAHKQGYVPFWDAAQLKLSQYSKPEELERAVLKIVHKTPMAYGKLLKEKALPVLEAGIGGFKGIKAPQGYADKLADVVAAVDGLDSAVNVLAGELQMIDAFEEGETELKRSETAWFNSLIWDDPQYLPVSFKYGKFLGCVLKDKKIADINPTQLGPEITKSCESDQPGWFRRVAFQCFPMLSASDAEPDQGFKDMVAAIRKQADGKEEKVDQFSRDAIVECVTKTREAFEAEQSRTLSPAMKSYEKARSAFLEANNAALGNK